MTRRYLSVALFTEGGSDKAFLRHVLDRQIKEMSVRGFEFDAVAVESCRSIADADRFTAEVSEALSVYNIVLIHHDHRERGKIDTLAARLQVPPAHRLLGLVPVRETEAWTLADPAPFAGLRDACADDLPRTAKDVERFADPKATLHRVLGCRATDDTLEFLGERISLDRLALVPAYQTSINDLTNALKELHYYEHRD